MSQIKVEEQIGGTIVNLKGQFIGGDETEELKNLVTKLSQEKNNKVIISLEKVTYLNSTALGVLISAHASFAKRGGKILLCGLNKSIENIFMITKLTLVFDITETLEEAIKLVNNEQ